ncbi:2442_t:CDS:2 [Cetraspora pellucida]|uniref:2442_t:CDS:1 n=1 Tax=Cetraspora pellucida TaxID=1433469 RepID=A0A9N9BQZ5_9GLOM|nr:2442_t:CDS:2 [Cetraspora pellucida]
MRSKRCEEEFSLSVGWEELRKEKYEETYQHTYALMKEWILELDNPNKTLHAQEVNRRSIVGYQMFID